MSRKNKIKRRKREQESIYYRKGVLALQQWRKEYFESLSDYPITEAGAKKKRLNLLKEFRKLLKKPKQKS